MEVIAKSKYIRQSPSKLRLVADLIRGLKVNEAIGRLENLNKKAAQIILQVLKQGVGNATNNLQLKAEGLRIKALEVGEGPRYKRTDKSHRAFRWGTIHRRTAHLKIVLEGEEKDQKTEIKSNFEQKNKRLKIKGQKNKVKKS